MKLLSRTFLLISLTCLLLGCFPSRYTSPPPINGIEISEIERESIRLSLLKRQKIINSYRALFLTEIRHKDNKAKVRHVVIFDQECRIRIEMLPLQMAKSLSLFISNCIKTFFYDSESGEIKRGLVGEGDLARYLRIAIKESELKWVITGMELPTDLNNARYLRGDTGDIILTNEDETKIWRYNSDVTDLLELQIRDPIRGRLQLSVKYGGYSNIEGYRFPHQIQLEIPRERLEMDLILNSLSINKQINPTLFDMHE